MMTHAIRAECSRCGGVEHVPAASPSDPLAVRTAVRTAGWRRVDLVCPISLDRLVDGLDLCPACVEALERFLSSVRTEWV